MIRNVLERIGFKLLLAALTTSAACSAWALDRVKSQECVALAMYWEARGEGRAGMEAVGAVVLNRVDHQAFPDTPCAVVFEGGERPPCQFSWWCDGKSDRPRHMGQWRSAMNTARDLLDGHVVDSTGGALFFHHRNLRSPWRRPRQRTARIGNHVFYR